MPSLQLGVDVVLIFVVVSPLDGDERLIAVDQLSTDVNICVCTTRDSSLLPRCRVQTTTAYVNLYILKTVKAFFVFHLPSNNFTSLSYNCLLIVEKKTAIIISH